MIFFCVFWKRHLSILAAYWNLCRQVTIISSRYICFKQGFTQSKVLAAEDTEYLWHQLENTWPKPRTLPLTPLILSDCLPLLPNLLGMHREDESQGKSHHIGVCTIGMCDRFEHQWGARFCQHTSLQQMPISLQPPEGVSTAYDVTLYNQGLCKFKNYSHSHGSWS
jgi:hypothetical protein